MKAVILAAGLGTRLRPLTFAVPKALVYLRGKPLINYVIDWLKSNGVSEVAVVGHYMQRLLEIYLAEFYPEVAFFKSPKLLGTAGQLYYAREWIDGDVVVVNVDVLTNLDLRHPLSLHTSTGAMLTLVAARQAAPLRFGVLDVERETLRNWREKPVFDYLVFTGVSVVSREALGGLREEFLDMNTFAKSLSRVSVYVAREASFYDVGTLEDLAKAPVLVGLYP